MRKVGNCLGNSAGWNPLFSESRRGQYFDASKLWIVWLDEAKRTDDEDGNLPRDSSGEDMNDSSIIQDFMRGLQGSYVCDSEAKIVENFCDSTLLKLLWTGQLSDLQSPRNIWFARSYLDDMGCPRQRSQWLTPHDLFGKFGKDFTGGQDVPVTRGTCGPTQGASLAFPDNGDAGGPSTKAASWEVTKHSNWAPATIDQEHHSQPEPDHLLIFVNDPDPLSFCALIGTVSCHLASALSKTLYNHVASVATIEIDAWSGRFPTFQLLFALPYFAWRSSPEPFGNKRRTRTEQPLRRLRNVSLLSPHPDNVPSFLYEAQISCVIAGFDEWTWTAHCLVDSYFDGEAGENVQQYSKDATDGLHTNPFGYGLIDAQLLFNRAREFFLQVLAIRLSLVKGEWQRVVTNVKMSVCAYEARLIVAQKKHQYPLPRSRARAAAEDIRLDAEVWRSSEWLSTVTSITSDLSERLSHTVDACARFGQNDAVSFWDIHNITHNKKLLNSIQSAMQGLEGLRTELEAIIKRCEDFGRLLEIRIKLESIRMGNCQSELVKAGNEYAKASRGLADDNNKLARTTQKLSTIMMLYVSPIALTAGIFSMDENVIPFIPPNFASFVLMTFFFGVVGYFFQKYQDHLLKYWQNLQTSVGQLVHGHLTWIGVA
ncbi:hypothetical protein EDD36DRAFT_475669 [Exophiala viscosa]|uniref:Uncharacterized protein n=1 Tax=Exophiala viscosa TaxID=2486360 RepID=A0AAN6DUP5_9EURO|nr:hypothetical protein EDD36DRAFT_475669 [Exophiala viscosa]